MPQAMSSGGEADTFAAEFVLGTLDADERRAAHALLATDESFAERVKLWERRLGELHLMVEPVEPVSDVWPRIKTRMPEVQQLVETRAAAPEPEPELQNEALPEPLSELHAAEEQAGPELQPQGEAEAESEAEQKESSPPVPAGRSFESLLEALEKPTAAESPPQPETPPPLPPAAPAPPAAAPAASWHLPPETPAETPTPPASPVVAPPLAAKAATAAPDQLRRAQRSLTRWRALTIVLLLVLVGLAGVVAAWRFVPERIPPALQPLALMRLAGIPLPASPAPRKPAPPESNFQE
jgi:hypothetical protein